MQLLWLVVVLSACSFRATPANGDDNGDDPGGDDGPFMLGDVAHVPAAVEQAFAATSSVAIGDAELQTGGTPALNVALPADAVLRVSEQDGGGPELAILEVGALTITGTLTVRGSRPLVIISRTTIVVSGVIEASASSATPGPGGGGPGAGMGAGGPGAGNNTVNYDDGGGGGGGFGEPGAAGQASGPSAGGKAGGMIGTAELARLEGGSGGGDMSPPNCPNHAAGAGGGAVQLYAARSITIGNAIRVNGGGGGGGLVCAGLGTSGAGGGSGGAIYLQAPVISGGGLLLAQGGGGGGGGNFNASLPGGDGGNGAQTIAAASAGTAGGTTVGTGSENNAGGTGGYRDAPPSIRTALSGANFGNGGGGGGGVGRIVVRATTITGVQASPAAVQVTP